MPGESASTERIVFTVGHSNRPLEAFLDLLARQQIDLLVDVRSSPYSEYAGQFNRDVIQAALRSRLIRYLFLGDVLGGRPQQEEFYDERGFVLYDRVAQSPAFLAGIDRLLGQLPTCRAVLLCGEEDPTHCHRRLLVGRVLQGLGVKLFHLRGDGRVQSEDQVAREEEFRKTKGQKTLFDIEEPEPWRSTRSVSPRKAQPTSSASSAEPEPND